VDLVVETGALMTSRFREVSFIQSLTMYARIAA